MRVLSLLALPALAAAFTMPLPKQRVRIFVLPRSIESELRRHAFALDVGTLSELANKLLLSAVRS
jgi:hypothetical protein